MAKRPAAKPQPKPKARHDHDESRPWSPDSPQKHHGHIRRKIESLQDAITFLFEIEELLMAQDARIVAAQNRLSTSLATLASDVAALKANQNPDTEANVVDVVNNLNEAADSADAIDATIKPVV